MSWIPITPKAPPPAGCLILVRMVELGEASAVVAIAHHYRDGTIRYRRPYADADQVSAWHRGTVDAWQHLPNPYPIEECDIPRETLHPGEVRFR